MWRRSRSSKHKPFHPKEFLEDIPLLEEVHHWAPNNNDKKDGLSRIDKELKDIQQKRLNSIKIQLYVMLGFENEWDPSESINNDNVQLSSMHNAALASCNFLCDLENKTENSRKTHSIQGSVINDDQLFSKHDVNIAKLTNQMKNFRPGKGGYEGQGKDNVNNKNDYRSHRGQSSQGKGKGTPSFSSHSNQNSKGCSEALSSSQALVPLCNLCWAFEPSN